MHQAMSTIINSLPCTHITSLTFTHTSAAATTFFFYPTFLCTSEPLAYPTRCGTPLLISHQHNMLMLALPYSLGHLFFIFFLTSESRRRLSLIVCPSPSGLPSAPHQCTWSLYPRSSKRRDSPVESANTSIPPLN